jgi:SAM-dependent methyltransferase
MKIDQNELFYEILKFWFIRPESSLLIYRRSLALINSDINWEQGKNLDLSCGDGSFSFIAAGGKYNNFFDAFINIDNENIKKLSDDKNVDILDSDFENYKNLNNLIATSPNYQFAIGTDWKQNLLSKASKLNFYNKLILQDHNNELNIETGSIDNIYSNSIYWVRNIDLHLKEIYRILSNNGKALLQIKTEEFNKLHPINSQKNIFSKESLNILDRGRLATWKTINRIEWWLKKFESLNLKVDIVRPLYSKEQVALWHYGFRPFAHVLIKMFNNLDLELRTQRKLEFLESILPIARDLAALKPSKDNVYEYSITLSKS